MILSMANGGFRENELVGVFTRWLPHDYTGR